MSPYRLSAVSAGHTGSRWDKIPRPKANRGSLARFYGGALLITAASLKTYQLATNPALGALYGSRWLSAGLIQYEYVLAVWLISGQWSKWCRRIAIATFVAFAVVAGYLAVTSAASCGCFGDIAVSPWIVVGVDCVSVLLMWHWKPNHSDGVAESEQGLPRLVVVSLFVAIISIPLLAALSRGRLGSVPVVLLEPEKWIGSRFPLLHDIDIGEQLANGSWVVVLYHHDCSHCQAVLPRYHMLASEAKELPDAFRVALVELPPYGMNGESVEGVQHGRVDDLKEWFVTAPAEILLREGQVIGAQCGDDVESELERRVVETLGNRGSAR
jgi:hypothetical protein